MCARACLSNADPFTLATMATLCGVVCTLFSRRLATAWDILGRVAWACRWKRTLIEQAGLGNTRRTDVTVDFLQTLGVLESTKLTKEDLGLQLRKMQH